MNESPITLDTWLTGLTLDEYVAGMKMNQSHMTRRLASVSSPLPSGVPSPGIKAGCTFSS